MSTPHEPRRHPEGEGTALADHRGRAFLILTVAGLLAIAVVFATSPTRPSLPCASRHHGIDVSSFQRTIDWAQVSSACLGFVYVRISAGTTPDTNAVANLAGARATGATVGAYQYFHPARDVIAQAQLMIDGSGYRSGDLPPAIDVETTDGLPRRNVVAGVQAWLSAVANALGVKPVIYTSPRFWSSQIHAPALYSYPLWIANYTTAPEPALPSGGWAGGWTYWQHSRTGHVPGIGPQVDLDRAAPA